MATGHIDFWFTMGSTYFERDEARATGTINRHQISLATIPLARHSSGDEECPLRG